MAHKGESTTLASTMKGAVMRGLEGAMEMAWKCHGEYHGGAMEEPQRCHEGAIASAMKVSWKVSWKVAMEGAMRVPWRVHLQLPWPPPIRLF